MEDGRVGLSLMPYGVRTPAKTGTSRELTRKKTKRREAIGAWQRDAIGRQADMHADFQGYTGKKIEEAYQFLSQL